MPQQKNLDVDIPGLLKNYLSYLFTLIQCIIENVDNCLDHKATIVNINTYKDEEKSKYYLLFASNGTGMTADQLRKAQVMSQHRDENLDQIQGRFGTGHAVSRSKFTENRGEVLWLSCHTILSSEEEVDKFRSNKFAQCKIDMDKTMEQGYIDKIITNEISRAYEYIWDEFAIEPTKPGVLLMYEISSNKYNEINENIRSEELEQNITYGMSVKYEPKLLKNEFQLRINGEPIIPLPEWPKEISHTRITEVYNGDTEFTPKNGNKLNSELIKTKENCYYATHKSNNGRRNKKILSKSPTNRNLLYTIVSTFCSNKQKLLDHISQSLKNMGIDVGNQTQKIWESFFCDIMERNGKNLQISKDTTRPSKS